MSTPYNELSTTELVATQADLDEKADSTSLAPKWKNQNISYQESNCVTYNGKAYSCVVAYTPDANSNPPNNDLYDDTTTPATGHWRVTDMTTPDATLDITAAKQLRVVAVDGTVLWTQGYNLATTSYATPSNEGVNKYDFAVNATDAVSLTLPTPLSGKVGDFVLDVTNPALDATDASWATAFIDSATYNEGDVVSYDGKQWRCATAVTNTGAWTGSTNWEEALPYFDLSGLGTTFNVVVPVNENLADMLTFAPGAMAELYFTQTSFKVNNLPTWKIVRQDVEGATLS